MPTVGDIATRAYESAKADHAHAEGKLEEAIAMTVTAGFTEEQVQAIMALSYATAMYSAADKKLEENVLYLRAIGIDPGTLS